MYSIKYNNNDVYLVKDSNLLYPFTSSSDKCQVTVPVVSEWSRVSPWRLNNWFSVAAGVVLSADSVAKIM